MRTDCKGRTNVDLERMQGYHEEGDSQTYAFRGFKSNKYFNSDRYIELDEMFRRLDGKPLTAFGLEIELEAFGIANESILANVIKRALFPLFPNDLFKMQHDGSLGVDSRNMWEYATGVECITQPMTKAFIRNHYKDFKAMYNTVFRELGMSCSKTGHCGMHVNISNALFGKNVEEQTEAIRKLHYFINKNFDMSCKLFKRDRNRTGYCDRMDYENARTMDIRGGSHYVCLNYSHFNYGRIELRLVGGQKDYYAFRNTMEVIFFLCDRMKSIKWNELDSMKRVFKGCNQYVIKRLEECDLSTEDMESIISNVKREDLEVA